MSVEKACPYLFRMALSYLHADQQAKYCKYSTVRYGSRLELEASGLLVHGAYGIRSRSRPSGIFRAAQTVRRISEALQV